MRAWYVLITGQGQHEQPFPKGRCVDAAERPYPDPPVNADTWNAENQVEVRSGLRMRKQKLGSRKPNQKVQHAQENLRFVFI